MKKFLVLYMAIVIVMFATMIFAIASIMIPITKMAFTHPIHDGTNNNKELRFAAVFHPRIDSTTFLREWPIIHSQERNFIVSAKEKGFIIARVARKNLVPLRNKENVAVTNIVLATKKVPINNSEVIALLIKPLSSVGPEA